MRRVAGPMATSSIPVANGSNVPVCPTLLIPASLRIRVTTSWEVIPGGLSILIIPIGFVLLSIAWLIYSTWGLFSSLLILIFFYVKERVNYRYCWAGRVISG